MKKNITLIAIVIALVLLVGYNETHYDRIAYIDRIEDNCYILNDNTGNEWAWEIEDTDNLKIGDNVTMKMFTNGSDSIYDDEIMKLIKR